MEARPYKKMCLLPAILLCQCYANYWPLGSKPSVCEKSIKSCIFFFVWYGGLSGFGSSGGVGGGAMSARRYLFLVHIVVLRIAHSLTVLCIPIAVTGTTHTSLSSTHCGACRTVLKVNCVIVYVIYQHL